MPISVSRPFSRPQTKSQMLRKCRVSAGLRCQAGNLLCLFASHPDVIFCYRRRIQRSKRQVPPDRSLEEYWILRDVCHTGSKIVQGELSMVNAAKRDGTLARVVESLQECQDRRFSRTTRSAEGVTLASADCKTNVFESGVIGTLRVAHLNMVPERRGQSQPRECNVQALLTRQCPRMPSRAQSCLKIQVRSRSHTSVFVAARPASGMISSVGGENFFRPDILG